MMTLPVQLVRFNIPFSNDIAFSDLHHRQQEFPKGRNREETNRASNEPNCWPMVEEIENCGDNSQPGSNRHNPSGDIVPEAIHNVGCCESRPGLETRDQA